MLQLRLTQNAIEENRQHVEISLEGKRARRRAVSTFAFSLTQRDAEDLRWYLEEYLQYPEKPAPAIAQRIEGRIGEIGTELFRAIFQSSEDGRDLWAVLRDRLTETRIEIVTSVEEASAIPWELLRDPKTDCPLALSAHSFVRAQPDSARAPHVPGKTKGKIRILLLIRPRDVEVHAAYRTGWCWK